MNTLVQQYSLETIGENIAAGTMANFGPENLPTYIDCGDERLLTDACQSTRDEAELPGRIYGGATGIALNGITAVILQNPNGLKMIQELVGQGNPVLPRMAAIISDRAHKEADIHIHQHSASATEEHDRLIVPDLETALGCAFAAGAGTVAATSATEQVRTIAERSSMYAPSISKQGIRDAQGALRSLVPVFGGAEGGITRAQLISQLQDKQFKTPVAIVEGSHCNDGREALTLDFGDYKAAADGVNYHHSVNLTGYVLAKALPEFHFDQDAVRTASLLTGIGTQHALQIPTVRVIPEMN